MHGSLAIGEITVVNCCFPEHPQKYCHDDTECITRTVNKTLEYVSNTPRPSSSLEAREVENRCDDTALCWTGMRRTQDWFMVQSGGNTWVWHDDHRTITKTDTLNSTLLHIIYDCFTAYERIKCGHQRGCAAENTFLTLGFFFTAPVK